MDFMYIAILIFALPVVGFIILKMAIRKTKKNRYGKLLFGIKDQTYIIDVFWGVGYFSVGIKFLIDAIVYGMEGFNPLSFFMFFPIYSIIFFARGLYKVEIREFGILTKDSYFEWKDVEESNLIESNNSIIVNFKLKDNNNQKKVTIHKDHKVEVENLLKNILRNT